MKVIELENGDVTLEEVMGLAKEDIVVLRRPDGSVYALSQVSDFEVEVELLKNNADFMSFLRGLSKEKGCISLQDLRKELEALRRHDSRLQGVPRARNKVRIEHES